MDSKEDYFQNNVQVTLAGLPSGCVGFSNSMLSCASGRVNTQSWPHELDYFSVVPKLKSNFEAFPSNRKIVVLKPNPGKAENAAKFSPLSTSFHDFHFGDRKGKALHCHDKGKNLANDMKTVRKWSSSSGFRGVDNHAKRSEMMMFSSKKFSDVKNCYRSSIYYPGRSYMAEKAKKQISERWRVTKEFQDGLDSGNRGRSRTFGEMLAMSDCESNPEHSYDKLGEQRLGNRINPNDKYRYLHRHDNLCLTTTPRFAINWGSQNIRKQNFSAKNCLKTRNSGSSCMESQGVPYLEPENKHLIDGNYVIQNKVKNSIEKTDLSGQNSVVSELSRHDVLFSSNHATQEAWLMHKDQKNKIKDGNLSEQNSVVSKSFISNCASGHMVSDKVADENMVADKSSRNHNEHNSYVLETSSQQGSELIEVSEEGSVSSHYSIADHNSLVNSEAQLSPVSVLETFEDEISSCSDFSKSIDAGLRGLRLQLEILKSKSLEEDSEGPGMIVSNDDDSEESLGGSKENEDPLVLFRVEESRDFSYIVDVLTEAGFCNSNHIGFEVWHSPEYPISPTVFDTVEKKYAEQASWKRSERKLLFDRINLGLVDILQTCRGIPMKAKPLVCFRQRWEVIEEELWTLLVNQEKEASKESQKLLGNDDGWLVLGNDIVVITREIENSLIDELAAEVVGEESFE
ncbi:hypothetical protein SLEP1_g5660 [Rubroshorea leprosula]|uniref:DUF4378 domain-containing protein n=1 Tax=Rubroshorea leprosula TaxID=152421 RepID=A0AAV5I0N5_9ROSI|nr:hypothetical protein SLEP1_g5660 [Rubroshorea leprosula]